MNQEASSCNNYIFNDACIVQSTSSKFTWCWSIIWSILFRTACINHL